MKDTIYFKQARLLLQALPLLTQEAVQRLMDCLGIRG